MTATRAITDPHVPPTTQGYHELQLAFDFFNRELFDGLLQPCFITLQPRSSNTFGYFSAGRFTKIDGAIAHEIGLNPRHFQRGFLPVTSTLAHEMCHAWQHDFGNQHSRTGYHNKEFAGVMLRIGLYPSHTGEPGGRMTGQQMSHYVIRGGRFDIAVGKLRGMLPKLTWFHVNPAVLLPKGLAGSDLLPKPGLSGRRTVYRCRCGQRAESNSTFEATCNRCDASFQPVGLR